MHTYVVMSSFDWERVDAIGVEYSTGFDYLMKYVLRKYAFHGSDFFSLQGL